MVSIVVPVYNAKEYLSRCVDSILKQSYKDIEVILVNDGSKDGSGDICDAYAKQDSRVRVIHQENAGPGEARNKGIELARGKYIGFVDSDDTICPNMYYDMVNTSEKLGVEMVMCGYNSIENDAVTQVIPPQTEGKILGKSDIVQDILPALIGEGAYGYASLWNKIYRKDFFVRNKLTMEPSRRHGEDWWFNIQAFDHMKSFAVCKECYYNYMQQNSQSLMRSFDISRIDVYILGYRQCKMIAEKYDLDLTQSRINLVMQAYSYMSSEVHCENKLKSCLYIVLDSKEIWDSYTSVYKLVGIHVRLVFIIGRVFGKNAVAIIFKIIRCFKRE